MRLPIHTTPIPSTTVTSAGSSITYVTPTEPHPGALFGIVALCRPPGSAPQWAAYDLDGGILGTYLTYPEADAVLQDHFNTLDDIPQ